MSLIPKTITTSPLDVLLTRAMEIAYDNTASVYDAAYAAAADEAAIGLSAATNATWSREDSRRFLQAHDRSGTVLRRVLRRLPHSARGSVMLSEPDRKARG